MHKRKNENKEYEIQVLVYFYNYFNFILRVPGFTMLRSIFKISGIVTRDPKIPFFCKKSINALPFSNKIRQTIFCLINSFYFSNSFVVALLNSHGSHAAIRSNSVNRSIRNSPHIFKLSRRVSSVFFISSLSLFSGAQKAADGIVDRKLMESQPSFVPLLTHSTSLSLSGPFFCI